MEQSSELRAEYEKKLKECEESGDSKGKAAILYELAKLEISEGNQEQALLMLMEAYSRFQKLGESKGHCFAGELLGQLLFVSGNREDGLAVVRESFRGFTEMGMPEEAEKTGQLLAVMEEHAAADG
ncbi:hypothetical protein [Desulfovibrio sp. JC022]|uniref:hypothetical protein n=1 Tax=Desulfovibrio sp. JC022 TaxID=2593642 RepID=UPI0013D4FDB7|nr:hypothetical protein [Desulfovibrio sp. JC022]NDV22622.1 hypothetical protein [Desulfovibrio sp. JC022]